jgi:PAS domain S-box-containing protein
MSILFLSLLIVSLVSYIIVKNTVTRDAFHRLESISAVQLNYLENINEQNLERLKLVSSRTQLRLSLKEFNQNPEKQYQINMNKILKDARSSIPDFKEISVINLDGVIVASTNMENIDTKHFNKDYFLRGQKENITNLFSLDKDMNLNMNLCGPLILDNELLGVLLISATGDKITNFVTDYSLLGETGYTLLVLKTDKENKFIISPKRINREPTQYNYVNNEDLGQILKKIIAKQKGNYKFICEYSSEPVYAMIDYSDEFDIGFLARINRVEILSLVIQYGRLLSVLSFISLLVMFISTFLNAKSITKPVLKLMRLAEEISKGDLDQRIEISSKDEIGMLSKSFNLMAENLKKDIDKREQVEKALRDSEEKFRTLVEQLPSIIYTAALDESSTTLYTSPQIEKILGISPEKYKDNPDFWLEHLHDEDRERVLEELKRAHESGKPFISEYRMLSTDDRIVWLRDEAVIIKDDEGNPQYLQGVMFDITERKEAEENLKNAKDELQVILNSVPAIIFYKDIKGRIVRANKTLADSLKIPVKDMIGKTTEELFPKKQAERRRKDDREVMISGKPKRNIIEPYDTPEGTRWAVTDKIPYKDKKGKVTGVIGLAKDITVQRKSEQKLQQTFQRLKKAMDATIETMSRIIEAKDPYTSGHQHRVCQLAVSLAQELGLTEDKIEGIRIASLIHDIGKIGLPTEILSKPTKLTEIEFGLIKGHSQIGYDILKSIDFSYPIAQIVLQHHERLDGSGYPNNSKGDEIFLEARILGIADVVEAMSSHRPYRPALGIDVALEEISKNRGILYDPEGVDVCINLFKEKGFKFK